MRIEYSFIYVVLNVVLNGKSDFEKWKIEFLNFEIHSVDSCAQEGRCHV